MDEQEFARQYKAYAQMLYKIAYVYFGTQQDAEEMVQETFIRLCCHAPCFENETHEKAWLIRVITNLCKNECKSAWKKRVERREEVEPPTQVLQEPDRELLALVVGLPEKYKAPVYLYYYEQYTVGEIAQMLGLSVSAVKMRLKRGREQLRLELDG